MRNFDGALIDFVDNFFDVRDNIAAARDFDQITYIDIFLFDQLIISQRSIGNNGAGKFNRFDLGYRSDITQRAGLPADGFNAGGGSGGGEFISDLEFGSIVE